MTKLEFISQFRARYPHAVHNVDLAYLNQYTWAECDAVYGRPKSSAATAPRAPVAGKRTPAPPAKPKAVAKVPSLGELRAELARLEAEMKALRAAPETVAVDPRLAAVDARFGLVPAANATTFDAKSQKLTLGGQAPSPRRPTIPPAAPAMPRPVPLAAGSDPRLAIMANYLPADDAAPNVRVESTPTRLTLSPVRRK